MRRTIQSFEVKTGDDRCTINQESRCQRRTITQWVDTSKTRFPKGAPPSTRRVQTTQICCCRSNGTLSLWDLPRTRPRGSPLSSCDCGRSGPESQESVRGCGMFCLTSNARPTLNKKIVLALSCLWQFDKDGFAVIENFLNDEDVEALKQECWSLVENMNPDEHNTTFSTTKHVRKGVTFCLGRQICCWSQGHLIPEAPCYLDQAVLALVGRHGLFWSGSLFQRKFKPSFVLFPDTQK